MSRELMPNAGRARTEFTLVTQESTAMRAAVRAKSGGCPRFFAPHRLLPRAVRAARCGGAGRGNQPDDLRDSEGPSWFRRTRCGGDSAAVGSVSLQRENTNLKDQSQLSTFIFGMNNVKGYQAIDYSPNIRFFKERGWRAVEAGYPIHPTP